MRLNTDYLDSESIMANFPMLRDIYRKFFENRDKQDLNDQFASGKDLFKLFKII